jgi:hypothetical protein
MPQLADVPRPQQTRPEKAIKRRCGPRQFRSPRLELDLFAGQNTTGDQHSDRSVGFAGRAHPTPPAIN